MNDVLRELGSPQSNVTTAFHVAGTNGKGSTIAFMRAIAEAAKLTVNAFTKPHLFVLNERFVVRSEIASNEMLISMADRVAAIGAGISQFDAQVATALALFDENPARLTLIETGMGGRQDSTNVMLRPTASIITPIALDHQDTLGRTLSDIAAHKAGILKRNSPAVVARQPAEALKVIEAYANEIGAPLFRQGAEWDCYESNGRLVVQTDGRAIDLPLPGMKGRHQIDNAGLACAAFLAPGPFDFSDDTFAAGVSAARLGARLQRLHGALASPLLAQGGEVWVDGGHNAHAAQALACTLAQLQRKRTAPVVLIIGMRARKDAAAFIAALAGEASQVIAVPLSEDHVPPAALAAFARDAAVEASTAPSLGAAMQQAAHLPAPRVLICGSFLLAAEALALDRASSDAHAGLMARDPI